MSVKMEPDVKDEPMEDSSYMDDIEDGIEEAGDLDFSQANRPLWLGHLPKSLWESLSQLEDNDEIDIGTIRVEGPENNPSRISLMLNRNIPQLQLQPKEYNLKPPQPEKVRSRRSGTAFLFSEKDLPGYKSRPFQWDEVDEDGNPGQGRSYLYEKYKREVKRKENKGKFVPYTKRPIPKQTAMVGVVDKEFELVPVKNKEFEQLELAQAASTLKMKEKSGATLSLNDPSRLQSSFLSMAERARINRGAQQRKQLAKESRAARMEKHDLIDKLLTLFRQHRIWGLRDLKAKVQQPESYLRSVLDEIAFMWKHGDFNGKWELKEEYKQNDTQLLNAGGVAPKAESDLDASGLEDDEDETFEDV